MKTKVSRLFIGILISMFFYSGECRPQNNDFDAGDADAPIKQLVIWLSGGDANRAEAATRELTLLAKESARNRKIIIASLVQVVEQQNIGIDESPVIPYQVFLFWKSANEVFANLSAIEAIDSVMKCIYCSGGIVGDQPTFNTLMIFGRSKFHKKTVSKLAVALRTGNKPTRSFAATVLGDIGGPNSKSIIRNALRIEKDKEVQEWISLAASKISDREPMRGK